MILDKYFAYDVISEIPVQGNETCQKISDIKKMLSDIENSINKQDAFYSAVDVLARYLGYETRSDHLKKLFQTVTEKEFYAAFETEKNQHIAITFHSSKGLEFEQVIVFAEDYNLFDKSKLCNHYVAVTRAKSKLIIVKLNNQKSEIFQCGLVKILSKSNLTIDDVMIQK